MEKAPPDQMITTKPYPIQLLQIGVRELWIQANTPPAVSTEIELKDCAIYAGHSPYDKSSNTIVISIKLELGKGKDDPVSMRIELRGLFHVDEQAFPIKALPQWALGNAPVILLPYLREQTYALTARCGFKPLVLPLVEVQTIKIDKPKAKRKVK